MTAKEVLEQVKNGAMSVEEADRFFQEKPYEDLGYAKLDLHRRTRSGYPEVVFCQGKENAYLTGIFKALYEKNGLVMGTRASSEQAELVKEVLPSAAFCRRRDGLRSAREERQTLQRRKRLPRRQSSSAPGLTGFMMSESADFTGFCPVWSRFERRMS